MQLATTLWSKSATFHVQLGVLSCTVNRACVSASLGRSVHVVVSLRKSTTDTYLWGRPDSGCLTRARYRHLTRPSSSCEGRLRWTKSSSRAYYVRSYSHQCALNYYLDLAPLQPDCQEEHNREHSPYSDISAKHLFEQRHSPLLKDLLLCLKELMQVNEENSNPNQYRWRMENGLHYL